MIEEFRCKVKYDGVEYFTMHAHFMTMKAPGLVASVDTEIRNEICTDIVLWSLQLFEISHTEISRFGQVAAARKL